jgi:hypothetical protein
MNGGVLEMGNGTQDGHGMPCPYRKRCYDSGVPRR